MIEFPGFKEEEWFVSKMKGFCVHGNTAPENFDIAYDSSSKRKTMVKLINDAIPGYFPMTVTDILGELIKCSYDQLMEIKERIDKTNYIFSTDSSWDIFIDAYESFVSKGYNVELVKKYGIKCCPYCNENFILSRYGESGCQLDHFFPKEKYPIFAICLYNLIPVCPICNHAKKDKLSLISPHDHSEFTKKNRNNLHISYEITQFSWPYFEDSITTTLMCDDSTDSDFMKKVENDFTILKLYEAYQYHKDYILEIIEKAILYNDYSIELIQNSFQSLFFDEEEILRCIFGNYYQQEDLLKRPLSKMTRDLLIELELVKKEK